MKDIFAIARTHVVTALRERVTLFWFLIFPLFLLTLLSLIFGSVTDNEDVQFVISLIAYPQSAADLPFSASAAIEEAFTEMATPDASGRAPLFVLHVPSDGQDLEAFLDAEVTELRRGRRAAVLVLPEDFDRQAMTALSDASSAVAGARLYMSSTNVASETASSIIDQVFAELDRNLLSRMGRFDESQAVRDVTEWVGQAESEVAYIDFALPAIVLMGFFTSGLFGVPGAILFNRDLKVLRRYWVTPLSVSRYLAGFGLGHLSLCALQFVLIVLVGTYGFGASIRFSSPTAIATLILAVVTFMAFGFLITSLVRTANAGMATANILNMPMMFLSGMFFPVANLPAFMKVVILANPVTYLLESLRQSVGAQEGTMMPSPWTYVVPLLWIAFSTLVATRRLRWDVER